MKSIMILQLILLIALQTAQGLTDQEKLQKRQDFFDPYLKSNNCKQYCIDEGRVFCANTDFSGGYCCKNNECPSDNKSLCSNTFGKGTPRNMKYFVCPNEKECGTRDLYPKMNELLTRAVEKYTENTFVSDDVCSYIVHPPPEMSKWDKLKIRIDKLQSVEVVVTKSRTFEWNKKSGKDKIDEGDEFQADAGYRFLVTGVSQTVFKGSFRMRIWVEPRAPVINHVPEPKKEDDLEKFAKLLKQRQKEIDINPCSKNSKSSIQCPTTKTSNATTTPKAAPDPFNFDDDTPAVTNANSSTPNPSAFAANSTQPVQPTNSSAPNSSGGVVQPTQPSANTGGTTQPVSTPSTNPTLPNPGNFGGGTTTNPSGSPTTPSPAVSPTPSPAVSPTTPSPAVSPTTPNPAVSPTTPSPAVSPTSPSASGQDSPISTPTTTTPPQPTQPSQPGVSKRAAPKSASIAKSSKIEGSVSDLSADSKKLIEKSGHNEAMNDHVDVEHDHAKKDYSDQMLTISVSQAQGEFEQATLDSQKALNNLKFQDNEIEEIEEAQIIANLKYKISIAAYQKKLAEERPDQFLLDQLNVIKEKAKKNKDAITQQIKLLEAQRSQKQKQYQQSLKFRDDQQSKYQKTVALYNEAKTNLTAAQTEMDEEWEHLKEHEVLVASNVTNKKNAEAALAQGYITLTQEQSKSFFTGSNVISANPKVVAAEANLVLLKAQLEVATNSARIAWQAEIDEQAEFAKGRAVLDAAQEAVPIAKSTSEKALTDYNDALQASSIANRGVLTSQKSVNDLRITEDQAQNKIKNATQFYNDLLNKNPLQSKIDKAKAIMVSGEESLNKTRILIVKAIEVRNKLQKQSFLASEEATKRAVIVMKAQTRAGIPKKLSFGNSGEKIFTELEIILSTVFVLLVTGTVSVVIYRKILSKRGIVTIDDGTFNPEDTKDIKKLIIVMNTMKKNGTLDQVQPDLEMDSNEVKDLQNQINYDLDTDGQIEQLDGEVTRRDGIEIMSENGRSVDTAIEPKKKKPVVDPKGTLDQILKNNKEIEEKLSSLKHAKKNSGEDEWKIDDNPQHMKMEDQSNAIISAMNILQKNLNEINETPNIYQDQIDSNSQNLEDQRDDLNEKRQGDHSIASAIIQIDNILGESKADQEQKEADTINLQNTLDKQKSGSIFGKFNSLLDTVKKTGLKLKIGKNDK